MNIDRIENTVRNSFDKYELFFVKERVKKFESREKELYDVELKEEEGIALRVIKNNKLAFSYTYDDSDNALSSLLENTKNIVNLLEDDEGVSFAGKYEQYPSLELYDSNGIKTDDEQKIHLLVNMEKAILDCDRRIIATRNCELREIETFVKIVNSNGLNAEGGRTLYILSALCVAKEEDEVSWYDWSWSNYLKEINGEKFGIGVAQKTISFLSGEQIPTGIYSGILTPQASCDMLSILAQSFLGENLYKDKTKLKDKMGIQCFSERITITDSGFSGMGAFPFDGEGVSSKENTVVKSGYFQTFLYDCYYGKKFGYPSTGNAVRRSLREPPQCGPRGLFIQKGDKDLINDNTEGIVIEELIGTHTANTVTGDFSLGAIGHLYQGGRKIPFKGVIFSGNIFELFNNVKEAGPDLQFYGTYGSPSLLIEGIKISGK